jgi:hypothetical protein
VKLSRFAVALLVAASISPLFSQHKVPRRNLYERLILVVPLVGTGTPEDPRRPMYAPVPGGEPSPDGILGFSFIESDDGQRALVELVARDRAAFAQIFADKHSDVKIFEKGKAKKEDIEKEFKKYKRDFNLDQLALGVL